MNLKSKAKDKSGMPIRFAYLIVPTFGDWHNDQELYAAVRAEGRAVLRPFKGATYELETPIALSPEQFEAEWKGD